MAEFTKTGINSAISSEGFTVHLHAHGGVDYTDANGLIRVDSELLIRPTLGYVIYEGSRDLIGMPASRAEKIMNDIVKALEFLGHRIERG